MIIFRKSLVIPNIIRTCNDLGGDSSCSGGGGMERRCCIGGGDGSVAWVVVAVVGDEDNVGGGCNHCRATVECIPSAAMTRSTMVVATVGGSGGGRFVLLFAVLLVA